MSDLDWFWLVIHCRCRK